MADIRSGIEAKLARGFEHLDELDAQARAYGNGHPVQIVLDPSDADGFQLARLRLLQVPPHVAGVIAGEAIHQFRSSLDHLMTALVWLDHPGLEKTPTFPLYMRKTDFDKWVNKENADRLLRPDHLEMIREVQPYVDFAARPIMQGGFLNALRNFDNLSKHQVVHAASVMYSTGVQSTWPRLQHHPAVESYDWRVNEGLAPVFIADGHPFFRVRFKPGAVVPTFALAPHPTIAFGNEDGQLWYVELMRNFGTQVVKLIDRFYDAMTAT